MNQPQSLSVDDIADFTWDFGQKFFLETSKGNFIWSDPDYGGDNTIRPFSGQYQDWISEGVFGRSKGKHIISRYCGSEVKIIS